MGGFKMAERKKVDRKRKMLEEKIRIYKKNNKALGDMIVLYRYFVVKNQEVDLAAYLMLEEIIKDLEDKDVNVPFKAENIGVLFQQDRDHRCALLRELKESGYYDELEWELYGSCHTAKAAEYYDRVLEQSYSYDFFSCMCRVSVDFVSEFLCSNIEMSKKVSILHDVIIYSVKNNPGETKLECILDSKKAGYKLGRTPVEVKEQKINELIAAFRIEMDQNDSKKEDIWNAILSVKTGISNFATNWLCFFQEQKLVDFMSMRKKQIIDGKELECSLCTCLKNFRPFYQLEDYRSLPQRIRYNDDMFILYNLPVDEIASFITLPNYQIGIRDIKVIAKRVFDFQESWDEVKPALIENIKEAILEKAKQTAKGEQEYKAYCELIQLFEQLADYKSYKEQKEEAKENGEKELLTTRHEVILRLCNRITTGTSDLEKSN